MYRHIVKIRFVTLVTKLTVDTDVTDVYSVTIMDLNLRDFPEDLMRKLRVESAIAGTTLKDYCVRLLSQPLQKIQESHELQEHKESNRGGREVPKGRKGANRRGGSGRGESTGKALESGAFKAERADAPVEHGTDSGFVGDETRQLVALPEDEVMEDFS